MEHRLQHDLMIQNSSRADPRSSSLSHNKPKSFIISIFWGLILFALILGLLEGFAHTKYITKLFPLRSVGSYHTQFELKWFALQDYVKKNHGVDVVLLGNSMVNTGIDPSEFEDRYQSLSGQKLRVFNFGVEGLTVEPLSLIAEMINERYHPGTIILFTEMRDYIAGNGDEITQQFYDNPWMRYEMGIPTLEGYLIEHTASVQYLLTWRNWSSPSFIDTIRTDIYRKGGITESGYEADHNESTFNPNAITLEDPGEKAKLDLAVDFKIDPSRALNLQEIISLNTSGVRVIVTEVPVYPTYFDYFGAPWIRVKYLKDIGDLVEKAGGVFIPPVPQEEIPLSGRVDDHHLNYKGAPLYSELLADQLFAACENQNTCLYPAPPTATP